MGGLKYKLYYEDEGNGTADRKHKPLRMIYVDGSIAKDSSLVDFDDWESSNDSRDVHFIWPDGTLMNSDDESGLGDHYIFMPDSNLDTQVMYLNLGGFDHEASPTASNGIGIANLVNP